MAEGRPLSAAQLLRFERKGHVATRGLLSASELAPVVPLLQKALEQESLTAWRHRVSVLCPPHVDAQALRSVGEARRLLEHHGSDAVGFLQTFNLHRRPTRAGEAAMQLVASPRLGATAAQLLGCPRVRVYQSCVFVKEPGMAETNWHSDLAMVPLDTNAFVTVWMPLRSLGPGDAQLAFASGSHRDFALPFWRSDAAMSSGLEGRGYAVESYPPLQLGDATWHHGWALHSSPGQPAGCAPRVALAVSYFADGARRLPPAQQLRREPHGEDAAGWEEWLKDVPPRGLARHAALPLVYGT